MAIPDRTVSALKTLAGVVLDRILFQNYDAIIAEIDDGNTSQETRPK